jgi:hypothetical protein
MRVVSTYNMIKNELRLTLPNPHREIISVDLLMKNPSAGRDKPRRVVKVQMRKLK